MVAMPKEQGIDTTDTENRVLPAWMFPRLQNKDDRHHFSRPDAILLLPITTCSSQSTAANSDINNFNVAKFDHKHWEIHLMELNFVRTQGQDPSYKEPHNSMHNWFLSWKPKVTIKSNFRPFSVGFCVLHRAQKWAIASAWAWLLPYNKTHKYSKQGSCQKRNKS